MKNIDPEDLLKRYHNGECTPEEEVLVECFYLDDELRADELSEDSPRLKDNRPIKRIVAIVSIIIAVLGALALLITLEKGKLILIFLMMSKNRLW